MGLFGKSFDQRIREAVAAVGASVPGVHDLKATVDGKVVTLEGRADSLEIKGRVMAEFNKLVNTENTLNRLRIPEPQAAPPAAAPAPEVILYEVKSGDTLGAIAQHFYGRASFYPKIFEANRDVLADPDLIKVGQKLRIPKLS